MYDLRFSWRWLWRITYSGRLHHVALIGTDVSEERSAWIIKVTRFGELVVTAIFVPSSPILVTLMVEARRSTETSVLTRVTRRNIPDDSILRSHLRENLKSYIENTVFRKLDLFPFSGAFAILDLSNKISTTLCILVSGLCVRCHNFKLHIIFLSPCDVVWCQMFIIAEHSYQTTSLQRGRTNKTGPELSNS
jgi:hypothetical protein